MLAIKLDGKVGSSYKTMEISSRLYIFIYSGTSIKQFYCGRLIVGDRLMDNHLIEVPLYTFPLQIIMSYNFLLGERPDQV